MKIVTSRLILDEVSWDDLGNIHLLYSCPEVDEYNTTGIPTNINETRSIFTPLINESRKSPPKCILYNINDKYTKEFIGITGLLFAEGHFKSAEVFYKIMPRFWNNGFATETLTAILTYGFENLNLHRIEAEVAKENKRSINVLEKAKFQREGLKRKRLPIRGKWKDSFLYSLVEDDLDFREANSNDLSLDLKQTSPLKNVLHRS